MPPAAKKPVRKGKEVEGNHILILAAARGAKACSFDGQGKLPLWHFANELMDGLRDAQGGAPEGGWKIPPDMWDGVEHDEAGLKICEEIGSLLGITCKPGVKGPSVGKWRGCIDNTVQDLMKALQERRDAARCSFRNVRGHPVVERVLNKSMGQCDEDLVPSQCTNATCKASHDQKFAHHLCFLACFPEVSS